MSDRVFISVADNESLELHIGPVHMRLTELRIRNASNWNTPYEVLGSGGARMGLTKSQLLQLLAEWLRFAHMVPSPDDNTSWECHDSRIQFHVVLSDKKNPLKHFPPGCIRIGYDSCRQSYFVRHIYKCFVSDSEEVACQTIDELSKGSTALSDGTSYIEKPNLDQLKLLRKLHALPSTTLDLENP